MRSLLLVAWVLLALSDGAPRAVACGGPEVASFDGLTPIDRTLRQIEAPDEWASWGNWQREELRFLHPYRAVDPTGTATLWRFAHEGLSEVPAPSTRALDGAVARGDFDAARQAALDVIDALLALPPVLAAKHDSLLWRAVEMVELHPHFAGLDAHLVRDFLAGRDARGWPAVLLRADEARRDRAAPSGPDHPRAASLELWAFERAFAERVPNGWAQAVRPQVPAATWAALHASVDRWSARFPAHPLRDRAELFHVRIDYFAGAAEAAWERLVDLLPRRRVRALAEMRYLLLQDMPPSARQIDGLTDPVLITALASPDRITPARWARWWQLAQTAPSSPWAQNLEERLLFAAARRGAPLPPSFPQKPRARTNLWGKLRAIGLLEVHRTAEAVAQLALVAVDRERAVISARAKVDGGDLIGAVLVDDLPADTRQYLVRVLLDDAALATLAKRSDAIGREVRLERAIRATAIGDWSGAARAIVADDPARARLYRQAAALHASQAADARLELARHLVEHEASIFYDRDHGLYRGLSRRHEDLRRTGNAHEQARLARHLERSSARWRALKLFTAWLVDNPTVPAARDVLDEADDQYNRLINQGGGNYFFWGEHAKRAPEVAALRRVGKRIRARP